MSDPNELLNTKQIAALTRLSVEYVRELLEEGIKLKGMKPGGRDWLVKRSEVERFIKEREKRL